MVTAGFAKDEREVKEARRFLLLLPSGSLKTGLTGLFPTKQKVQRHFTGYTAV